MIQLDGCFEGVQLWGPISLSLGLVPSADYADPMGASALRRFISGEIKAWNLEKQVKKTADQEQNATSYK
ncbi:hypothetical protein HDV63DRAFT_372936 [Trichoderma sp. SZMC 28014]